MKASVAAAFLKGMREAKETAEENASAKVVAVWYGDRFYYEHDLREVVDKTVAKAERIFGAEVAKLIREEETR